MLDALVGAILGFASFLLRLYESEKPRAVLVGWDTLDAPTYRHEALESYQSGREFDGPSGHQDGKVSATKDAHGQWLAHACQQAELRPGFASVMGGLVVGAGGGAVPPLRGA
jgi:hypothetical protein